MAFSGKRVLVTGGAGCKDLHQTQRELVILFEFCIFRPWLETGKRFAAEGASVILLDKDEAQLKEALKTIPSASIVAVNLLDWDATKKALKSIGHVDHLINNAGVNQRQTFMDITPEAMDL